MNPGLEVTGTQPLPRSIGLVIVHGIGEPTAGEALADFTDSLETEGLASFGPQHSPKRLIATTESSQNKTAFFPAHVREGRTASDISVIAAEVYWGSATQLAPGRLGVLHGIMSLMLNVPALITGADEQKDGTPKALHRQARLASMLLGGPAFALNALLLSTLGAHVLIHYLFDTATGRAEAYVPFLAIAAMVPLGFLSWLWFPAAKWSFWLAGPVSLAISVAVRRSIDLHPFVDTTAILLEWLIGGVVALLLLIVGTYCGGRLLRQLERPSMTTLLVVCLQFAFWAAFVPLMWHVVLAWMPARARESWMDDLFRRAIRSDGVQWLMTGIVVTVLGLVVGWRELVNRTRQQIAPRLIVNPLVAIAIVFVTALGAVVILHTTIGVIPGWITWLYGWVPETHGTTALFVIFPLLVKPIRLGLDLAHDVISYIFYECEHGREILSGRRPVRSPTPVRSRFQAVVDYLVLNRRVERLIVVAHSQGSIIALDELAHGWSADALPEGISFVTFGSPISHLYGHYFPNIYTHWEHEKWDVFFQRVARWANFYRVGDYVGTTITPPTRCDFVEQPLGSGGHTDYFRDPRLLRALRAWDLFVDVRPPLGLVDDAAS